MVQPESMQNCFQALGRVCVTGNCDQGEARRRVVGPDGKLMSLRDLPPPDTSRWVARRKAMVVCAVNGGLLTLSEACRRYGLSVEEFEIWKSSIERHGVKGLRATRAQLYRDLSR